MFAMAISVLVMIAPLANHPPSNSDPFRGSQEAVSAPRHSTSSGMTLDKLNGLPLTRGQWPTPQPQVWVDQPYIWVYPSNPYPYGMGGYRPPGVGGNYRPRLTWWFW